jgi:transforming growth factor-beta-induced protein
MKRFKNLTFILLAFSWLSFSSCGDDEKTTQSIVDTAVDTEDLSLLVEALTQANLVSALEGSGPFTVFAPNNAAFQALLDSNPAWNSISDIDNATLSNVLKFHVIAGDIKASGLSNAYITTLATGPNDEQIVLQVDVTDGVKFNGSAAPVTTDIEALNGTIHIINEVMLPPNLVDLVVNNEIFSSLAAALTRSDLTTNYISILSGDGPFTVFAPTNSAFQALLDSSSDWNTLADIPTATLEAVLNYHVIINANVQSDQLSDGQTVETLGGTATIDLSNGTTVVGGNSSATVMPADVQGSNGVIHVINAVLLP